MVASSTLEMLSISLEISTNGSNHLFSPILSCVGRRLWIETRGIWTEKKLFKRIIE
jgi:hypothetical protein